MTKHDVYGQHFREKWLEHCEVSQCEFPISQESEEFYQADDITILIDDIETSMENSTLEFKSFDTLII